ncbi:LysR family transcriptional regulator [Halomonas sp. DP5Y7-2]|uniref:LysR substrate-binding domain-containing protein n=1 Tax=Halomonas sp. DP5Y7-2 TaxID=2859076 RepID=UPI001C99E170|nr:LysR substrate-binding domain-containing protein [Halomonas sp. DP5Y7-2]MBY5982958.1 LysR family transcriptional regulator [Halomonas sp. DP5Y7-2]
MSHPTHQRSRSRITLRQLEVFVAVARLGTVSAAARQLSLSQSATSQALADLERQLGVVVFERPGRRLSLNDTGHRLLPRAEQLLDELDDLVAAAVEPGDVLHGSLAISASATIGTYLLPPLAGEFGEWHPGVDLRLRLRNTGEVIAEVQRFDADLGLIEGRCHEPGLASEVWCEDHMVVVCAPGHPLVEKGRISDVDLAEQPWILRELGSGSREVLEAAVLPRVARLKVRMELGQHEAIKQAVAAGLGLGCLSRLSVRGELERGDLVELAHDLPLTRHFSLVWHPDRYRSPAWQAFKVFLVEHKDRVIHRR